MIRTLICSTASVCAMLTALPEFDHVKTQRAAMSDTQEAALQRECKEMNAEGKFRDLIDELGYLAHALETMQMAKIKDQDLNRISQLRERIHQIVASAENILRPAWTMDKWPYKVVWKIRFTDVLDIDPGVIETNFSFKDFELETLSLGGSEREDLYPLVAVTPLSQSIHVQIEKRASSLELCQLQSTWTVAGTVKYKFLGKSYEDRAELTLRPGITRPPKRPNSEGPIDIKNNFDEGYFDPAMPIECLRSPKCLLEQIKLPKPGPKPFPLPYTSNKIGNAP